MPPTKNNMHDSTPNKLIDIKIPMALTIMSVPPTFGFFSNTPPIIPITENTIAPKPSQ